MSSQDSKRAWLVQTSSGDLGPFTLQQLQQLAARGSLNRSSLLRNTKSTGWTRAEQIPSIFEAHVSAHPVASDAKAVSQSGVNQPPSIPEKSIVSARGAGISVRVIVGATSMVAMLLFFIGLMTFRVMNSEVSNVAKQHSSRPANADSEPANLPTKLPLTSTATATPASSYSTEDLVTRTKESVALIATPTGSGSGFVAADGVVVTNYHVIADCDADLVKVFFPDEIGRASCRERVCYAV